MFFFAKSIRLATCFFVNMGVLRGVNDLIPLPRRSLLWWWFVHSLVYRRTQDKFLTLKFFSASVDETEDQFPKSTWPWQVDGRAIFLKLTYNWTNCRVWFIYLCINPSVWYSFRNKLNYLLPKIFRYCCHFSHEFFQDYMQWRLICD